MSTTTPGGANSPDQTHTLGDLLARLTYRREKATYDGAVATLAPHWLTIAAAPAVFEAECLRNPRLRLAREAIRQKPEAPPMTDAAVAASPTAVRLKHYVQRAYGRDLDVESLTDAVVLLAETAGVSPDALWRLSLAEFGRRVLEPPPQGETDPPLTGNDLEVLTLLADRHPRLMSATDIVAGLSVAHRLHLSERTVKECVRRLIADNYAARPHGERKGAWATARGLAVVAASRG